MSSSSSASSAADEAEQQADAWQSTLGRAGLVARGVLYGVLGVIALQFAFGGGGSGEVSTGGVFQVVRETGGTWLLGLLAAGLVALALWEFVRAWTGDPVAGSDTKDRVLYAVKGVLYGATAASAVAALLGGSSGGGGGSGSGGGDSQSQAAGLLFGLPGGVFLVGLIGVGLAAYAAKQFKDNAMESEFMSRLATGEMSRSEREGIERAGRAGYGGRAVVVAMVGVFFVVAAVQHDPDEARGVGGALVTLSEQAWGPWLLGLVAAGLVLFGVLNLAEAKYRRDH